MLPDVSEVTPAVANLGGPAGGSRDPLAVGRAGSCVDDDIRRVPPRGAAASFLPPRSGPTGCVTPEGPGQERPTREVVTPVVMAYLDNALSSFRTALLADVSRVVMSSPAGSAQDAPRVRDSPGDTRKRKGGKGCKSRRRLAPSPSSSSSSSSDSSGGTDDSKEAFKVARPSLAVLECPDDRFSAVLNYKSYRLRNKKTTYGASQARRMGRTSKNMTFSFGGTPLFDGKQPLMVFLVVSEVRQGLRRQRCFGGDGLIPRP